MELETIEPTNPDVERISAGQWKWGGDIMSWQAPAMEMRLVSREGHKLTYDVTEILCCNGVRNVKERQETRRVTVEVGESCILGARDYKDLMFGSNLANTLYNCYHGGKSHGEVK